MHGGVPAKRRRRWWVGAACSLPAWVLVGLLLWPERPYRVDLLSHFVMHFGVALVVLGLLLAAARRSKAGWSAALGVGLAGSVLIGWHVGACAPPQSGYVAVGNGARTIKIVQYNAHAEQSANDPAFQAWLKAQDADLVCLIETPWSFARVNPWVREMYPYRVEPSMGLEWPNLLLSKHPLELLEMEADKPEHMFSFVARRSVTVNVLGADGKPSGLKFAWSAMHPVSPRRESSWRKSLDETQRDAGILLRFMDANPGMPVVVTGDFNSAPTGQLHQRFGRITGLSGWSPVVGGGTWPANLSPWVSVPIDRVWTSRGVVVSKVEVGPRLDSDHRPIVAWVEFPGWVE